MNLSLAALALAASISAQDSARLTLESAVRGALAHYPSVAAARAGRQRAAAELDEATALRMPRLSLEGSATRYQEPMLVYPLHGLPAAAPAPGASGPAFDRTLIQGSAFLSWTLADFGARAARSRAAREIHEAAGAALGAAEADLIRSTAAAYFALLGARATLAAHDLRLRALHAEAERVGRLLAEGKAARVEQLRVEAARSRALADRVGAAGRLEVAERDLEQLTGTSLAGVALAQVAARADAPAYADTSRTALLARALEANRELAEAGRRSAAARELSAAARATRFPELRLSTGIVDHGRGRGDFQAEWQAGLGISWALWTGGSRSGLIRRAEAEQRLASERQRLASYAIASGLDRALASLRESEERLVALRSATRQSEEVAHIERTALDIGSGTQTDYLEAEAVLLGSRANLIEATHAALLARVDLARITGDLSLEWLARTLENRE
jgi:outer membrane protein